MLSRLVQLLVLHTSFTSNSYYWHQSTSISILCFSSHTTCLSVRLTSRKLSSCLTFSSLTIPPLGPWFVGEIIDGHWGVCFAFALYINGTWLPVGFTYVFSSFYVRLSMHVCMCEEKYISRLNFN